MKHFHLKAFFHRFLESEVLASPSSLTSQEEAGEGEKDLTIKSQKDADSVPIMKKYALPSPAKSWSSARYHGA